MCVYAPYVEHEQVPMVVEQLLLSLCVVHVVLQCAVFLIYVFVVYAVAASRYNVYNAL
jgi:hypothetical protein